MTRRAALGSAALGAGAAALGGRKRWRRPAHARPSCSFTAPGTAAGAGGASRDLLEAKGHKVFAPSLTGNGDRSHLLSKDVILDTHIADIVNLFKWEDIKDACLVAHSYGGWPSSGALEQIHDRVSSIVWLDAFKPENGQKGTDFASEFSRKAMEEAIAKGDAGPRGAAAVGVRRQREGPGVGQIQTDRPAERRGDAADQAHRRAREDREEDLHPRAEISAGRVRQGAGGMQGRQDLEDVRHRRTPDTT